ncbi:MAG TPA: DUF748 domain-containing protein [Candidatus Margulisiibacteriota bacterium]|nr:DUF748 domain-containing protein [Candidatus Margulisiibacteriota bacterium]
MNIAGKIIKFALRVISGILVFYLFLSLILIPLLAPWIAASQATKLLGQKVEVRSIQFNPFLLRLTVKGLKVTDSGNQVMVGFDKFWGDLSFISLLKGVYRVESLGLEGLRVNAVLSGEGNINLLSLVPKDTGKAQPQKSAVTENTKAPVVATSVGNKPLPLVVIDLISVQNSVITFTDKTVNPNFITSLGGIDLRVTGLSTRPEAEAKISFQAKLDDKGTISTEARIKPFVAPLAFEMVFKLNNYALGVLTPYVGKYTGRKVKDGKLDLSMDYRVADNKLEAAHKILVQRFDFGEKVESKDALNLPFGLAVALLEDPSGRINISLPVTGDMSKPDFKYLHLIGQVLRNFFIKLVTKPFSIIVSMAGVGTSSEDLDYVKFSPGRADLSGAEKEKLNIIIKTLNERPKVSLEINGSYDPVVDWKVIKIDVFNHDFKFLREKSRHTENRAYQILYQNRFGIQELWKLTRSYRSKEGIYDEEKINAEIKRRLIEGGAADKVALNALAEARARAIYDFIIAAGFEAKRVSIGEPKESRGSADFVPLELTLTVFESPSN